MATNLGASVLEAIYFNLLSPYALCFLMGVLAKMLQSDLQIPKELYASISIFLLFSIGLHGGVELAHETFGNILLPVIAALLMGVTTPVFSYIVLRRIGRLSVHDSAGIAAHYGSVSAVTFIAAQTFALEKTAVSVADTTLEGYLPALLALLEIPGIAVALTLGIIRSNKQQTRLNRALKEVFLGRTIVLLIGGLLIGLLMHPGHWNNLERFFSPRNEIFRGALCLFLIEMGILSGARLNDVKKLGAFLGVFGIAMPILFGSSGVILASLCGLSLGGSAVFGAICSSASYIAAPPAVRMALPEANPALSLTAALVITFPFNIVIGIPLCFRIAQSLF